MKSNFSNMSDNMLLLLIKNDDKDAFDELYDRLWNPLFGQVYNILHDTDICMDLVQDIFVWFWVNRAKWDTSSPQAYLAAALKFKAANYIRNNKVRAGLFAQMAVLKTELHSQNNDLEVQELLKIIKDITDRLPKKCRAIFQLSRYDQLSNKEIAKLLDISEKTVENQITIALKKLRKQLGDNYLYCFLFL